MMEEIMNRTFVALIDENKEMILLDQEQHDWREWVDCGTKRIIEGLKLKQIAL